VYELLDWKAKLPATTEDYAREVYTWARMRCPNSQQRICIVSGCGKLSANEIRQGREVWHIWTHFGHAFDNGHTTMTAGMSQESHDMEMHGYLRYVYVF
jgi:hypothetical protein